MVLWRGLELLWAGASGLLLKAAPPLHACKPALSPYATLSPSLALCPHPQVTVELKNDLAITGTLHSVDQYLNIKLSGIRVVNQAKYPHMLSVRAGVGQRQRQ